MSAQKTASWEYTLRYLWRKLRPFCPSWHWSKSRLNWVFCPSQRKSAVHKYHRRWQSLNQCNCRATISLNILFVSPLKGRANNKSLERKSEIHWILGSMRQLWILRSYYAVHMQEQWFRSPMFVYVSFPNCVLLVLTTKGLLAFSCSVQTLFKCKDFCYKYSYLI